MEPKEAKYLNPEQGENWVLGGKKHQECLRVFLKTDLETETGCMLFISRNDEEMERMKQS